MFTKKFSQIIPFVAMEFLKFSLKLKICSNFSAVVEKKNPEPEGYGSTKNSFGSGSRKLQMREDQIRKTAPMCTHIL